jgi:hypothetical protein
VIIYTDIKAYKIPRLQATFSTSVASSAGLARNPKLRPPMAIARRRLKMMAREKHNYGSVVNSLFTDDL